MEKLKDYVIEFKSGEIKGGRFTRHQKVGVWINFYGTNGRVNLSIPHENIKEGGIKC